MEGENVEVEDVSTMQAETRSVTFTNDYADTIGEPMVSQNQGGEAGAREAQCRTTTTTQTTQQQKFQKQAEQPQIPEENSTEEQVNESIKETNDHLSRPDEAEGVGGSCVKEIVEHDWRLGQVHFKVEWSGGDTTWEHLKDMHEDYPG